MKDWKWFTLLLRDRDKWRDMAAKNNETQRDKMAALGVAHVSAQARIAELEAKLVEAKAFANSRKCVYCSATWEDKDTHAGRASDAIDHAVVCPGHPMRKLETELEHLRGLTRCYAAEQVRLRGERDEARVQSTELQEQLKRASQSWKAECEAISIERDKYMIALKKIDYYHPTGDQYYDSMMVLKRIADDALSGATHDN